MSEKENSKIRILVTGASGFIASHVVLLLLKKGYKVRGTVRSLKNEKKVHPLRELYPEATNRLELVEADLLNAESWIPAVQNCDYVIHVASPFPSIDPPDPNEIIAPAVEGTLAVLKAAHDAGVKRVVMTSSAAAILGQGSKDGNPITEDNWTSVDDDVSTYSKSKVLAEKAAWDFVKDHPKLEFCVLNPGYVVGPVLHNSDCTSAEVAIRMLQLQMPMVPDVWYTGIDVRDVALAHLNAIFVPEAAGQRIGLGVRLMSFLEMAEILRNEFAPQGYWVSAILAPYWGVWFYSFFDKGARMMLRDIGRKYYVDTTKMRHILKIDPTDLKKSVIDMGYSVIERGFVKKTSKYKGQPK